MLIRLLRVHLRPYVLLVCVVLVLQVVQTAGSLFLPTLNGDLINSGVLRGDTGYIWRVGGVMLGIALGIGVVSAGAVFWASRVSSGVGADIRERVFGRVQGFSAHEMNRFGTASLVTRNTNDVQQVQLLVQLSLTVVVVAPITIAGGILLSVREGAALSPLVGVAIPVMGVVMFVTVVTVVPLFRSMQRRIDRLNEVMREQVTGVRVIRAFHRVDAEQRRFDEASSGLAVTALRANRIFAFAMPVFFVILDLSTVAVLWFGGRLVSEGSLPIGNLTAFLSYIMQILGAGLMAVMMIMVAPRAVASAERIGEVVEAVPVIADPPCPSEPARVSGVVEFRGVGFGYPGSARPVLSGLSFTVVPGQVTAVIGGTGSGKSTLVNLIPRFFDASSGTVLVNGIDVREQAAEQLWSGLGLVPQDARLFRGTVASNLRFGRAGASEAELWHALEVAQASEFVAAMAGQLDGAVDQGGTNLSGGQRQRLSIARALIRRPRLYLFDDCFSALDPGTDARLRAALRAETGQAAVLIVAQRVSTIMDAAQIIVLDGGVIAGAGTHRQLLAGCGPYREIVASQLGEGMAA
jgi:ABC-type multidrug transport system fused ATPase/permease subunit